VVVDSGEHIVIHPRRHKKEQLLPENGLLLANPSEAGECLRRLREDGYEKRFLFNSNMVVGGDPLSFAAGPAIGAPMAALSLEKMIALGARRVILFGWCGAISPTLQVGDVVVPDAALSGEGTSGYYCPDAAAPPAADLSSQVVQVLKEQEVPVHRGCVWSTDAVYREDRRLLKKLHLQRGVVAVDMEFSALCAVAAFRKIEFSAVLAVSDELWGDSWRPGFNKKNFIEQKQAALQVLLQHLAWFGKK
jgi:uridine phosphorylase